MKVEVSVSSEVERTPRVMQAESIFDVPPSKRSTVSWNADLPIEDQPWNVGLIVGPSGCGKSTIARHVFGDEMKAHADLALSWSPTHSVLDGFPISMSIKDVIDLMSSVGFSSPPNWLRPFRVLSNGEQFRVMMARTLAETVDRVAVVDEFTSVVDRTVAQIGSASIAKTVRRRGQQFVAISCHEDILEWLQPDWVFRPADQTFAWRSLRRRPDVEVQVVRVDHDLWRRFAPYHYMSESLHRGARCFAGLLNGEPIAFGGLLHMPHPRVNDITSLSRLIVLPDYQGLGLGVRGFTETLGRICRANGRRMRTHPAHPSLIRAWAASPIWTMCQPPKLAAVSGGKLNLQHATTRKVAHFEWGGGAFDTVEQNDIARQLWT